MIRFIYILTVSSLSFSTCFKLTSWDVSNIVSAFLSNSSSFSSNVFCSFLYAPLTFLAHPLKYWRNLLIFACHFSEGVCPSFTLNQISLTISINPSHSNHPNSNLNTGGQVLVDGSPVFRNNSVWSDISRVKVWIVVRGNLDS